VLRLSNRTASATRPYGHPARHQHGWQAKLLAVEPSARRPEPRPGRAGRRRRPPRPRRAGTFRVPARGSGLSVCRPFTNARPAAP